MNGVAGGYFAWAGRTKGWLWSFYPGPRRQLSKAGIDSPERFFCQSRIEVADGTAMAKGIQLPPRFGDRVFGFAMGVLQDARALMFDVLTAFCQPDAKLFDLPTRGFLMPPGLGRRFALKPDLREELFKFEMLRRQLRFCPLNYVAFKADSPGDGERVGLAGQSNGQTVGRAKRFEVELHRGVPQARVGVGERLQLPVVSCRDDRAAALKQRLKDGTRKRGPFGGVRAGAQLVEQDKGAWCGLGENRDDVVHVG